MSKVAGKHDHVWRIISHEMDFSRVLVGCGYTHCIEIRIMSRASEKVNIGPRKYRPATKQEFIDKIAPLEHLCCA